MVHAHAEHEQKPPADPAMRQLRATWGTRWRIWRGRRDGDPEQVRHGNWVASRTDPVAGVHPTVIADTAGQLDHKLVRQALLAEAVRRMVEALRAQEVLDAEPVGNQVRVMHHATGRCDTIAVAYDAARNRASWAWLRDDGNEPLGPADDMAETVQKIQRTLARPWRAMPEPEGIGLWGDG